MFVLYQEPALEMQIQYAIDTKIGETLVGCGLGIAVFDIVFRSILQMLK